MGLGVRPPLNGPPLNGFRGSHRHFYRALSHRDPPLFERPQYSQSQSNIHPPVPPYSQPRTLLPGTSSHCQPQSSPSYSAPVPELRGFLHASPGAKTAERPLFIRLPTTIDYTVSTISWGWKYFLGLIGSLGMLAPICAHIFLLD